MREPKSRKERERDKAPQRESESASKAALYSLMVLSDVADL